MRVLQINTSFQNGGSTGRIAYGIAAAVSEAGWESYAAFSYGAEENKEDLYRIQGNTIRKANILRTRVFGSHGFYNEIETKRLIRWIESIKPDLIQLHNLHNHYINVGELFKYLKNNNIPVVWTLHDCWSFTGWCAYFDYNQCNKWKTGCYECPAIHEYPFTWFMDRSSSLYKRKRESFCGVNNLSIVTPSKWLSNLVSESFLNEYNRTVIYNGTDIEVFKPNADDSSGNSFIQKYQLNHKKIVLSVASVFDRRKGTDFLIKIPEMLPEDHTLVMVGVSEDLKRRLSPKCIPISRTENVFELAKIYSIADVFINPTLEDNFPTTNIEALACGTPVITYDTGGSPEAIDKKTGIIIPKGNENEFIKAIVDMPKKNKAPELKDNCRLRAEKLFKNSDRYNDYCNLYKEVINYD